MRFGRMWKANHSVAAVGMKCEFGTQRELDSRRPSLGAFPKIAKELFRLQSKTRMGLYGIIVPSCLRRPSGSFKIHAK